MSAKTTKETAHQCVGLTDFTTELVESAKLLREYAGEPMTAADSLDRAEKLYRDHCAPKVPAPVPPPAAG